MDAKSYILFFFTRQTQASLSASPKAEQSYRRYDDIDAAGLSYGLCLLHGSVWQVIEIYALMASNTLADNKRKYDQQWLRHSALRIGTTGQLSLALSTMVKKPTRRIIIQGRAAKQKQKPFPVHHIDPNPNIIMPSSRTPTSTLLIPPALSTMLLRLPTHDFLDVYPFPDDDDDVSTPGPPSCLICFHDIPWRTDNTRTRVWSHLDCGQVYHEKCYDRWRKELRQRGPGPEHGNANAPGPATMRCPYCTRTVDVHIEIAAEADGAGGTAQRVRVETETAREIQRRAARSSFLQHPLSTLSRILRSHLSRIYITLITHHALFLPLCDITLSLSLLTSLILGGLDAAAQILIVQTLLVLPQFVLVPLGMRRPGLGWRRLCGTAVEIVMVPVLVVAVWMVVVWVILWVVSGEKEAIRGVRGMLWGTCEERLLLMGVGREQTRGFCAELRG
ncbi:MAG: hypothetical protein Q9160_003686 [Pyrenula sp. 1 TL-2023]